MKRSKTILLKRLNLKNDITQKYKNWMNDFEVHKFTSQFKKKHTIDKIKQFVREKNISKSDFLFGIFLKKNSLKIHIGNIKLGLINHRHKTADISYFIGEKSFWGKGYASIAIKEIIKIAKKKKIKKLRAGAHELNIGSQKVLIKNGFKIEGRLRSEVIYKRKRYDVLLFGAII